MQDLMSNELFQMLLLIFVGFLSGVLATIWYFGHVSKNVLSTLFKSLSVLGVKIKSTDITVEQLWKIVTAMIDKAFKEVEHEQAKTKFKEKIEENNKNRI